MKSIFRPTALPAALLAALLSVGWVFAPKALAGAKPKPAPHSAGVDRRGDQAMGFSHEKTAHHFRLYPDGGAIEIVPTDPKDTENRDAIRSHLKMISGMFQRGDFHLPMFIHAQTPPGVATMQRLKAKIRYRYEETPRSGRVRISSKDPKAVTAIHEFLRFQIKDHRTGDPLSVRKPS